MLKQILTKYVYQYIQGFQTVANSSRNFNKHLSLLHDRKFLDWRTFPDSLQVGIGFSIYEFNINVHVVLLYAISSHVPDHFESAICVHARPLH